MEGRNRLNCEFGQCLSVEYCTLLDKHADESKEDGKKQISYVKSGT